MASTSTSIMASPSAPLQVLSTVPGVPLPAEVRHLIYRFLFAGSVIELSNIDYWPRLAKYPNKWITVKARHQENSGWGILFASKDSQADVVADLYSLVTWLFRGICPQLTEHCKSHIYDLRRLERVGFELGTNPYDFLKNRQFLPGVKHLLLSVDRGFPLSMPLPPQHLDNRILIDATKDHLRDMSYRHMYWLGPEDVEYDAPCPKQDYSVSCTLCFKYPPYELKNGGVEPDDASKLVWSSKWIFDVNEESIARHGDTVTIEEDISDRRHLRAFDADGENELDDEDEEEDDGNVNDEDVNNADRNDANQDEDENSEDDEDREPGSDEAEETDDDGTEEPHLFDQIDWNEPLEPSDEDDSDSEPEDEE